MRYSRRANYLSPARSLALLALVLLLVVFLVLRFLFPGVLEALARPLWSFGTAATALVPSDLQAAPAEVAALRSENEMLKARLRDVGAERELPGESGILAGVMARPPLSPYDTLAIDRGTKDGLMEGMTAYAFSVPVGTVADADTTFARVLLYSAPERITEGWAGEGRHPVTLIGAGSGAFEADVPKEAPILEGDLVYVPGPGALPIGQVERIETNASSPRAVLRIKPLVNPFTITWVRVLP